MSTETQHKVVKQSPLSETFRKMGAAIRVDRGWEGVAHFTSPHEEAEAVRRAVGLADWSSIPKFELQGGNLNSSPELGEEGQSWRLRAGRYLVICGPEDADLVRGALIIAPSVNDEEAKKRLPDGWKQVLPYIRLVPQPKD